MIVRTIQTDVIKFLEHFPAVGILGPRQVGKTTLAKTIAPLLDKPVLYLDLELDSDIAKLSMAESYLAEHDNRCIILDEIQRMPELFPLIRALIDKNRMAGRFLILGSASPLLIQNSAESLAGRITYCELSSLNLVELSLTKEVFKKHWLWGGFPEVYLQNDDKIASQWLVSFIENYIYRDIVDLGLPASPMVTKRLLSLIANMHGQILVMDKIAKALGSDKRTVARYIDFLEEAFLLHRLQPYFNNKKKRLVKSPKLYIRDSGILHNLLGINSFDKLISSLQSGFSFEGYVVEQIKQLLPNSFQLCFYTTHDGAELDLVILENDKPYVGIEIKYSDAPKVSRGNNQVINELDTKHNYIITPYLEQYKASDKITVCNICDFLGNILPEILAV